MVKHSAKKAWILWSLANLFFAFQFILRLSAGVLRESITEKFAIDAASFGTLAGYYYLGYAGSQIPLGIMLDKFSFRVITFLSITIAAIGTLTFTSDDWNVVIAGRFLIGAGSGVAFLSVAKVIKSYFDEKHQSFMIGLSFSFGLTGAVFGSTPMLIIFNHFGYNNSFYVLSGICLAIALLMLIFGRLDPEDETNKGTGEFGSSQTKPTIDDNSFSQIIKLLFDPKLLIIGFSGAVMVGSLEGFADVWAFAYFEQAFGMSKLEASTITSFVFIGMCFGGPILASWSKLLGSELKAIFLTAVFTIFVFLFLFYIPKMNFISSCALMFFMGILCCYQVLVFSIVNNLVSTSHAGLAIAITNCINMSFGHVFHQLIGYAINFFSDGSSVEPGAATYTREVLNYSLLIIPAGCFLGLIGFIILSFKSTRKN